MKTRAELIHRALRNLGVLPQGQSPSAEEYVSVSDLVDGMLAELNARDIIYIADADQIADEHFLALGNILAWKAAPEFGAASDQALAALATQAEMHLSEIDRKEVHWNGKHWRVMQSDYPVNIITSSTSLGNI